MKDNLTPFPGPNGSAPHLPDMTPAERRVWAASHNLPENMLLVTADEMHAMNQAFQAAMLECQQWRQTGKLYMGAGADLPETFEPALRTYMAERERLEKVVKRLTTPQVKADGVRPAEQ